MKRNYANGKLLITGEYLILEGAYSLAIPCSRGQNLDYIQNNNANAIDWRSLNFDNKEWFSVKFESDSFDILRTSDKKKAKNLQKILIEAYKLSNIKLVGKINTALEFPNDWGLGSSSTLIACLSKLLKIDPFELHFNTSNGSGYDVACGIYDKPITYLINNKKPIIEELSWDIPFKENLFFVHLNKKQKSELEISRFKNKIENKSINVKTISDITSKIITCKDVHVFNDLIEEHEDIIGYYIGRNPIKKEQFSDFDGAVKSLGAWGGDFVMVSGNTNCNEYFKSKGFNTIIPFKNMIKSIP